MPSFSILRLALANFVARRARFALTILAVAFSVSLVVSITSGYASLEHAIRSFVDDYIGTTDFELTRPDDPRPAIAADVIERLRADPRVRKITARVEAFVTPLDDQGKPIASARTMLFGVEDDPGSVGRPPRMDAGRFLKPGERGTLVVDQNTIEAMKKNVGDTVEFGGREKPMKLTIVGIVHKPAMMRAFFRSGYIAIDTLRDFVAPDRPGTATKLRGEFNVNVDSKSFIDEWSNRLAAVDPHYKLKLVRDNRADLDRNLMGLRLASYLGSTVSLSAAAFIILATLMTGVQEQRRQLAMLRAVGATRFQVARLVSLEGVAIGVAGALLGIPMGIVGLYALALVFPHVFDGGVTLAYSGMLYGLVVAALASFVASILPAIAASRAKPVEAMAASGEGDRAGGLPWKWIALGACLCCIDSLIIFGPLDRLMRDIGVGGDPAREIRLFGHLLFGLPMMMLGALLFAPLVVRGVELVGHRLLPSLLRLPASLLKQQLTESPWRSAATGVAMMIGLMLLITMNSQGRSALGAWKIPNRFPDVFIVPDAGYGSMSIKPQEIEQIRNLPQVEPDRVMPISVAAPTLGTQIFDISGTAMPDRTLFIGVDPALAFEMMELDFKSGDELTAKRMLMDGRAIRLKDATTLHGTIESASAESTKLHLLNGEHRDIPTADIAKNEPGKYLIVTEEFKKLRGFNVGDTFPLESGLFFSSKIDFVIVGVVWSPGLDVMLNTFDLPARVKEQTAATVFGSLAEGKESFGIRDAFLIAANLKLGADKKQMSDQMSAALGREGLTVADVRELKHSITQTFSRLLFFASTVAWLAMAVATIGVGNAIVAGIRTRQWRLGVLRAIGLTRAELLRLLLAEAILLSFVGVVLGVGFGLLLAVNAKHLYSVALGFDPPLVLPWDLIAIASAVVVTLGLLATIAPAALTARKEPLALLQAGRAAT